ncbi:MAG TPA: histidine kinase dimerization/phospho-acceptor domain-containing protein, partial [Flavisolibacter sp.]
MKLSRLHTHLPKNSLLIAAAILIALSFLSAWFFQSKPSVDHQQKLLQKYIKTQQEEAARLLTDTALLRKLVLHRESKEEFNAIYQKKFGVFVFAETLSDFQDLLFWNKQEIVPPPPNFNPPDSVYFQRLINGYYVVHKRKLTLSGMSSNMVVYALIPVFNQYYLQTQSSVTQFAHNEDAIQKIRIAERTTEFPINALDGRPLFHLEQVINNHQAYADPVTLILRLLALVLVLVYIHLVIETISRKRGALTGVVSLTVGLIICRLALFFFPGLFSLRQLPLFDPSVYGADAFNRSLGDLLISVFFLCWIILTAWNTLGPIGKLPVVLRGNGIVVAGVLAIVFLIFSTFQLANIIFNLVANSKISFDVTNFFRLNIFTVFGFIVLALLSLTYYYFTRLLFRFILLAFPNLVHLYFAVAIVGLIFLTLRSGEMIVLFHLPVLAWLVVYTLLLSQEQLIINRLRMNIAGLLFWIFIFSVSLAVLILQGNHEKEWRERRGIAEKYDQLTEPSKERTLRVALAFLTNDFLTANFSRFYREPENSVLRDSFINTNSLGYAHSYTTNFYVFDPAKQPINNKDFRTYEELNNILEVQSRPIGTSDLNYYETSFDQFIYITKREVRDSNGLIGSLFIVSAPKHFQSNNELSPQIFRQASANSIESSYEYSYAIYRNRKLLNHSGKYPFATLISSPEVPVSEIARKENGENTELWFKPANNKLVVIAKKKESLIESITLFSYLFCAFLFMVGILRLAGFVARLAKDRRYGRLFADVNIRTQIHGTIIFISALSFLVIGAATISFFVMRYNRNNVERISRTAAGAVKEMEQRIKDEGLLNNNVINFSDSSGYQLREVILDIADVHGMVVNLYDLSGTLRVSSEGSIYEKGVLSNKMHPRAFYYLNTLHAVQQLQDETASNSKYQSVYVAMRNENGDTYAYLNIPSFSSENELNQEISNFIVTIINLNAFIFLIAGVIALFITNRITRSFSIIGDKMKAITLGKTNEEIVWKRDDEIGELVTQYNKMVHQLEQSANALAKSEREGAWREMARQVAHEIKNPLTPMKLSIQYLQRAIQTNQPNVQQLTSNVATTLIEQIDHLSKIAADFSQFANISNKKIELIDLHTVIRSLVDLYSSNPKMNLQWHHSSEPASM